MSSHQLHLPTLTPLRNISSGGGGYCYRANRCRLDLMGHDGLMYLIDVIQDLQNCQDAGSDEQAHLSPDVT